jgi:integrase
VLVHGAVLDGGDVLQAVVSDHPDVGRLLQQEGRVAKDQVVNSLGLFAEDGGALRVTLFRRRFWLPAVNAAGLDGLRIHDLRHTAVALWIAAGANPKEVAARAGHASVSFTLDRYGHLYPEADLNLRDRLDAIWSASGGGQ